MKPVSRFLRRYLATICSVLVLLAVVVVLWVFSAPIDQWLYSAQFFDAVAFLRKHYLAAAVLGGCILVGLALIWLSNRQAVRLDLPTKEC